MPKPFEPAEYMAQIIEALVDYPDEVRTEFNEGTVSVRVAQSDLGKIIGVNGRTARALRIILNSAAAAHRTSISLDIES